MPYTKNTWTSGDIITKVKLDNIEDGIYNNSLNTVFIYTIYITDGNVSEFPTWASLTAAFYNAMEYGAFVPVLLGIQVGSDYYEVYANSKVTYTGDDLSVISRIDCEYLEVTSASTAVLHSVAMTSEGATYTATNITFDGGVS